MRKHTEIKGYDYKSHKEFESHRDKMKVKGWILVKDLFKGTLDPQELDEEHYKYIAYYIKSDMM